jgi:signal transduction histidine kinase
MARAQGQLREANEQLLLAALCAQELQAATEQAHRQQTDFLAVLAHELRDPLMPIRTTATLLSHVRAEELPRMQAVIERQVVHLSRLIGDLLDLSRCNTGKLRLESSTIDLVSVIDGAADVCRPAMETRHQRFSLHVPCRTMRMQGDPVRLTQVLCNLLGNSSKYTPEGGKVELSVALGGDAITITVADSGIGISAEALTRVFDPFVQDRHAIGYDRAGLGIGLTVVRELVEAHGGSVLARSAGIGKGSQFVVTLPYRGSHA